MCPPKTKISTILRQEVAELMFEDVRDSGAFCLFFSFLFFISFYFTLFYFISFVTDTPTHTQTAAFIEFFHN